MKDLRRFQRCKVIISKVAKSDKLNRGGMQLFLYRYIISVNPANLFFQVGQVDVRHSAFGLTTPACEANRVSYLGCGKVCRH